MAKTNTGPPALQIGLCSVHRRQGDRLPVRINIDTKQYLPDLVKRERTFPFRHKQCVVESQD